MIRPEPDLEEVGDRAVDDAVGEVSGGAAGNVTDRIFHGAVTDFFEVRFGNYHYPAFNVADSAIAIGAALIILDVLNAKHHAHEVSKPEAS